MRKRLSIIISVFLILFIAYGSAIAESVVYYADPTAADQGAAGTRTIKGLTTAIGANKQATIVLAHTSSSNTTSYTLSTDITIAANITLKIDRGAVVAIATAKTLTMNGKLDIGEYQGFSCTGTGKVAGLKESNPIWFGAKIDNATDDSAAWQSALDSIATTGGVLHWPVGTSYVTSTLIWPNNGTNTAYSIRLIGNSPGSTSGVVASVAGGVSAIRYGGTGYLFDMRNGDSSNLIWYGSIENGHLWGPDPPDTGYGNLTTTASAINAYRISHATLRNLQIKLFGIYGIHSASSIYYSTIDNVKCYYNGIGWYGESAQVNGTTIFRSAFSKSRTTGLAFSTGYPINIEGCWFEGNGEYGIAVTNPILLNIKGSYFENNGSTDISVTSAAQYNTIVNLLGNIHYETRASHYAVSCTNCAELNSIGCDYDKVYNTSTKASLYVAGISAKGIMAGNTWPKVYGVVPIAEARKADFLWIDATNPSLSIAPNPASYATTIADGSIVFNSDYDAFGGLLGWQIGQTGAGASQTLAGITATTTAGSKTVTVNSTAGLQVGATIEIAGETFGYGSSYTIISDILSDTSITIGTAAVSGVTTAAVSYHTATYKEIAGVIYDKTTSPVSSSGTGEDTLKSTTIPAGMMTTSSGFHVFAAGTKTGGNGNKNLKLYFGATGATIFPATNDQSDWRLDAYVFNLGATNSQGVSWTLCSGADATPSAASCYTGYFTASIDTTAATYIKLTGECAHPSDVLTMTQWLVEPK